jgi:undecaprenyl-diphosphatase
MLKLIFLGALQGLTEFFPVSSSGHLVIAQNFLGINKDVIFLDVFLHIGTLLALVTFFFNDIVASFKNPKTIGLIALVTVITGSIGLTFKKIFESFFMAPHSVAIFLCINGMILIATRFLKKGDKRAVGIVDGIVMGLAQGLAITPGISRSGLTIIALLGRGVAREEAFRFSFIASIPAIMGAFFLETRKINGTMTFNPLALTAALAASYLFGIMALEILRRIIKNNKLHAFGIYCLFFGALLLYFF